MSVDPGACLWKVISNFLVLRMGSCNPKLISSVTQLCPTLCDPMNHSRPGLPVHHQLPESKGVPAGSPVLHTRQK